MTSCKSLPALLLAFVLLSFSCRSLKKNARTIPINMPEVEVLSNDPVNRYRAAATKAWELIHTDIDIRFNIRERSAEGLTRISLHPYYYATDSLVLDAKGMVIESVTDGLQRKLDWKYDTAKLSIALPKSYSKEDTLSVTIRYKALPYAFKTGGSSAITDDRGLYFVNPNGEEPYQPLQIWTQGETSANSHWFPTFDNTNFRSTFQLTIHVPDSLKTLSNGYMKTSVPEAGGLRADTWKQDIPIPPYLVMIAAGNFSVSKEMWRGKEVNYYVPQEYAAYGKAIFARTPEMMEFFSQKLGVPFPWNKYSQVVAYDYVSGAMENVSASLFGAFNLKDNRQLADDKNDYIVAHELFHQWFGDYVTAESWSNLTLNESFATYGEQLWAEYKYGEDARQEAWRQDVNKYLNQAKFSDPPLVRFHYRSQEDMFDRVSYSKGGLILHYLRQLTGDKAFFDALHLYLTQNALHSAEAAQLRLAFEQVTGSDWNWFFDQWYMRGGHPELEVSYVYNDAAQNVKVTIIQKQADSIGLYRLPLKALIINGADSKEELWEIEQRKTEYIYTYVNGRRPLIVPDAAHWLPGRMTDKKSAGQWLEQYQYCKDRLNKRQAIEGAALLDKNDTAQKLLLMGLTDNDPTLRILAINSKVYEGKKLPGKEWIDAVARIAEHDSDNKARAAALNALGDLRNEAYTSTYERATDDSSYAVAAAAYYALDRVNHKRAVEYARKLDLRQMKGNALLYRAAGIIGKEGKAEDYSFFEQKTWQLYEGNRMQFLNGVQEYLLHITDQEIYNKGVGMLLKISLKSPDAIGSYFAGAILFNLKTFSDKSIKIATDKGVMDDWRRKRDVVTAAWQSYKAAVKDENRKLDIARMEKEQ